MSSESHGQLELSAEEILTLELANTREQLAQSNERLAAIAWREAQQTVLQATKQRMIAIAKLEARAGGRVKSFRIVDRNHVSYELE